MTIRALVVDDSAFIRNAVIMMLESDPEIKVVGNARNGAEAIEKVAQLKPDVVTLDIEMPGMDGMTALRTIMEKTPVPVIMLSSLTTEGARTTLDALDIGAVDFIPKNLSELSVNIVTIKKILIDKVKAVANKEGATMQAYRPPLPASSKVAIPPRVSGARKVSIVAIGTSTGGPKALQDILPRLPANFPVPIVIAQHMPANFTKPFADRLDQLSQLSVKEAEEGEPLKPGVAYIAPGRGHTQLVRARSGEIMIRVSVNEDFIYRPSVDFLMLSVAELYFGKALGVILTGMGNDGLKGLSAMKKVGCRILAQDEASCVVYGMPKAVVEAGIADKVLGIDAMADEIINSL
ncbi:MAG: chemotaxis response regulator protein-glutamate methylesterase [Methylococcaceae bacterium]|nr:chemotaxis response regulator protein-glutamate methylesterase [Desulfuromonas sp.]NJD06181.1 chemotaxis response regulator protein-glutamate methylesterase [Methylococcaceae bacterium]